MASKKKNPYRVGTAYYNVAEAVRKANSRGVTKNELVEAGHKKFDIDVVLSPCAEGTGKGDCRGSLSANGHVYYLERRKKQGEKTRFVWRWRQTEMDKQIRQANKEIQPKKQKDNVSGTVETVETTETSVA